MQKVSFESPEDMKAYYRSLSSDATPTKAPDVSHSANAVESAATAPSASPVKNPAKGGSSFFSGVRPKHIAAGAAALGSAAIGGMLLGRKTQNNNSAAVKTSSALDTETLRVFFRELQTEFE